PGVHEDGRAEFFGGLKNRKQGRMIEVPVIDVRADLHPGEAQIIHAALKFANGEVRRLEGQSSQAKKMAGKLPDDFGNVVVKKPGQVVCVLGLGPIAEHDGDGRKNLGGDAVAAAVLEPAFRLPAIVLNFSEELAVDDHAGTARSVMLQV